MCGGSSLWRIFLDEGGGVVRTPAPTGVLGSAMGIGRAGGMLGSAVGNPSTALRRSPSLWQGRLWREAPGSSRSTGVVGGYEETLHFGGLMA